MKSAPEFASRKRTAYAACYILLHMLILPSLLVNFNSLLPRPLSLARLNVLFDLVNFAVVFILMFPLLYKDLLSALAKPFSCLWRVAAGYGAYLLSMTLFSWIIRKCFPGFSNINDSQTLELLSEEYTLTKLCTVILVPITEELLYRATVFSLFGRKKTAVGVAVSVLLFSSIHVVGYIGAYPLSTLLICFLQYIPAGLCLCWAYCSGKTIWASILIHMAVNETAMLVMR